VYKPHFCLLGGSIFNSGGCPGIDFSDSTYKGSTAIFDLVDHVMGLYPVKGPEDDEAVDEDLMERSDRTFRFGTKDKTRFHPFQHFLRFDKERHLFIPADDPGNSILEKIQQLIPQKGIIQKDLLPILDHSLNIKQRRALALLQQGTDRYWSADKKPHLKNSITYKPFFGFADPMENVKLQNAPCSRAWGREKRHYPTHRSRMTFLGVFLFFTRDLQNCKTPCGARRNTATLYSRLNFS